MEGSWIMNFVIIFSLIMLSVFTTSIFFVMVYSMSTNRRKVAQQYKGDLVNSQSVDLTGINSIEIQCYQEDVYFDSSDSEAFIINEYRSLAADSGELATVIVEGDRLIITGRDAGVPNSKKYYRREEFCIPASFKGVLSVEVTSGNIYSNVDLNNEYVKASSDSGDIRLKEVIAQEIEVSTSSGLVAVDKAEGRRRFHSVSGYIKISAGSGDSEITTTSGGITMTNASGALEINTSSGGLLVTSVKGGGSIKTNSGRIDCTLQEITSGVLLSSSSGDIVLQVNDNADFQFEAVSERGNITTFFDEHLTYTGNGRQVFGAKGNGFINPLQITTVSGDINVNRY